MYTYEAQLNEAVSILKQSQVIALDTEFDKYEDEIRNEPKSV